MESDAFFDKHSVRVRFLRGTDCHFSLEMLLIGVGQLEIFSFTLAVKTASGYSELENTVIRIIDAQWIIHRVRRQPDRRFGVMIGQNLHRALQMDADIFLSALLVKIHAGFGVAAEDFNARILCLW